MPESFYKLLKPFIWPRYREEGPPQYVDLAFLNKEVLDREGKIKEPVKSILDLIVIGYRPITSLSILSLLVENQNRPMYGAQIGLQLEKKFELDKEEGGTGWFTKMRYYDTRIAKLLKMLVRQGLLEERNVKNYKTNKIHVGYRITENLFPAVKQRIEFFLNGESLSIFSPITTITASSKPQDETLLKKYCPNCGFQASSLMASYCELCGKPLNLKCPSCQKEISLVYSFCLNCGTKLKS